jgi:hypothetical protein
MVRTSIAAFALAAVTAAACSGSAETTTTTAVPATSTTATTVVSGSVVFGEGTMPDTVPAEFPVPDGAVIGDTLQDTASGRTEVVIVVPADPEVIVSYYDESLPAAGFDIASSGREGATHVIIFSGNGIDGEVVIAVGSTTATTVALEVIPTG